MEVDVIGNNKPVRQHHVPKVYLKNFRDENGSIAMYSKKNRRTLLTGLESVGVEKDFYTLEKLDDPYCWEKTYAKGVEPFMGELLPQIISKTNVFHSLLKNNQKFSQFLSEKQKKSIPRDAKHTFMMIKTRLFTFSNPHFHFAFYSNL